jgi:hypothetical protein
LKANGTTTEYFKEPDHFAEVTDLGEHGTTKLVYDGHECWQLDPRNTITQRVDQWLSSSRQGVIRIRCGTGCRTVKWSRKRNEVKFNEEIDESVFLKPTKTGSN